MSGARGAPSHTIKRSSVDLHRNDQQIRLMLIASSRRWRLPPDEFMLPGTLQQLTKLTGVVQSHALDVIFHKNMRELTNPSGWVANTVRNKSQGQPAFHKQITCPICNNEGHGHHTCPLSPSTPGSKVPPATTAANMDRGRETLKQGNGLVQTKAEQPANVPVSVAAQQVTGSDLSQLELIFLMLHVLAGICPTLGQSLLVPTHGTAAGTGGIAQLAAVGISKCRSPTTDTIVSSPSSPFQQLLGHFREHPQSGDLAGEWVMLLYDALKQAGGKARGHSASQRSMSPVSAAFAWQIWEMHACPSCEPTMPLSQIEACEMAMFEVQGNKLSGKRRGGHRNYDAQQLSAINQGEEACRGCGTRQAVKTKRCLFAAPPEGLIIHVKWKHGMSGQQSPIVADVWTIADQLDIGDLFEGAEQLAEGRMYQRVAVLGEKFPPRGSSGERSYAAFTARGTLGSGPPLWNLRCGLDSGLNVGEWDHKRCKDSRKQYRPVLMWYSRTDVKTPKKDSRGDKG